MNHIEEIYNNYRFFSTSYNTITIVGNLLIIYLLNNAI